MSEEIELIAPCGLYCGSCYIYQAGFDKDLAEIVAKDRGYAVEDVRCVGCRGTNGRGWPEVGQPVCETYECCVNRKNLQFCSQCDEFPCLKLAPCRNSPPPHNMKVYNLVMIKKMGAENWVKEAGETYTRYFRKKKVHGGEEPLPDAEAKPEWRWLK